MSRFYLCRQPDSIAISALRKSIEQKPSSRFPADAHRASALKWVRVLLPLPNKKDTLTGVFFIGAGNRPRTGTLLTARDFKSLVSTDFTMPAGFCYLSTLFSSRQDWGNKEERGKFSWRGFPYFPFRAGPDSERKHPGSCPGTSPAPDGPWPSWIPRSALRRYRTRCCPPSALPGT